MIRLMDIKNALVVLLAGAFEGIDIVTEDISQISTKDFTRMFPFLHIQLTGLQSQAYYMGTRNETVLVDITYMAEEKSENEVLYGMLNRMQEVLGYGIAVGERFLKIERIDGSVVDDLLHILFSLSYNNGMMDEIPPEETGEILELRRF